MRLVDRNPMGRKRSNRLVPSLTFAEKEQIIRVPEQGLTNSQRISESQHNNMLLKPTSQSAPNKITFIGDKTITTHVDTNAVYDSVKHPVTADGIVDWKILTLKQLRRDVQKNKRESQSRQKSKNHRGIHVSLSKENRRAVSSEKMGETSPNSENKDYTYLRKLSGKGRLIDKIQLQMSESTKEGIFFC